MFPYVYGIDLILSILCVLYMVAKGYRKINRMHWTLTIMILFVNLGYLALSVSRVVEEALLANALLYLGGTIVPAVFLVMIAEAFEVHMPGYFKNVIYVIGITVFTMVWFGGNNGLYFKTAELSITKDGTILVTTPGPFSRVHDVYIWSVMFLILGIILWSAIKKRELHTSIFKSYLFIASISFIVYTLHHVLNLQFEILPELFLLCEWVAALYYNRNLMYDIDDIVSNTHETSDAAHGYVAFDLNRKFIAATRKATELLPEITAWEKNRSIRNMQGEVSRLFLEEMDAIEMGKTSEKHIRTGDSFCKYKISYFSIQAKGATKGYLIELSDDTERQKNVEFMENYNRVLKNEVQRQTEHIREIQESVVLGLANMIENRDNNTGGHVKRTSDIVKILVDTMMENKIGNLERSFGEDIIRAAPMHDLGKIAIDNSILLKPGRLTEEEFDMMRSHAPKSGEIVLNILDGVEEQHFIDVAFNVARHHHERWDGNGYPDRLSGKSIPMEARIMAIADVYDALVSKRCYKEAMSFEQASSVMLENMGSQFDPMMQNVFLLCRAQLEEYYSENLNPKF